MVSRDGARISLWQNSVSEYTPNSFIAGKKFDVAIAGGGITGLSLALLLQQKGVHCIVFEAEQLGFGTTGGTTAHLNTLLDTPYSTIIKNFGSENAKLVASAARDAIGLIKDNIARYHIACEFQEAPAYLFSQTEDQDKELDDIYEACINVGLQPEFTFELPVPLSFNKVMKVDHQAKFHPLRYLFAIAQAFESAGGTIVQHCRVTNSEKDEENENVVNVETSEGMFQANALVYATHIPTGINLLHLRLPPYRSYAMAVKLEDEKYPDGLAYDMYDPYHYYRTQQIDGKNYLIVGGEDHKTGEESNTNGSFLKLESHVRSHFKVDEIAYQWSSQYYEPVDGIPYIGQLPGHPENVFVATGFGGNGMTYSHVAALVLSGLILKEVSPYSGLFSPGRVKPLAGFAEFVKHNADVVKQFVGKWFGVDELQELAGLAPGEGKVVKYEDQAIALYKDERGMMHAVSPTCTHMKCSVNWNIAEKSWDCPCHGARYSFDGKVLNAPADKNLEPVQIGALESESIK